MEEINESLHLQLLDFDKEKRAQWMRERESLFLFCLK